MRIYEKGVSFVRSETKSGTKSAIICENEHFWLGLQVFNAAFVLNPER